MTSFVRHFVKCTVALSLLCAVAFAQPKPKAAVYVKGNPQGRDVLMMAVNTFLIKTGKYQMVAVDAIDLLAQEHSRQMGGSVSDNEIARLGQDAGAQYVCVVERTELDGISYVTTSMVSVQSKIAEFSDMRELPRGGSALSVIEWQINTMLGISTGEEQTVGQAVIEPPKRYESAAVAPTTSYTENYDSIAEARQNYKKEKPRKKKELKPRRPFSPSGLCISTVASAVNFRDSGGVERQKNSQYLRLGLDFLGNVDTRNMWGLGLFGGAGTYGNSIWSLVYGAELKNLTWIVKEWIAVPISLGFDRRLMHGKFPYQTAAIFTEGMSESDKVSSAKFNIEMSPYEFTPAIGLQIFLGRNASIYAGYTYNLVIPDPWTFSYTYSDDSYETDTKSAKIKIPKKYAPLQDMKESFRGIPGTLRVDLKIHIANIMDNE
jgi:hypothetical protein